MTITVEPGGQRELQRPHVSGDRLNLIVYLADANQDERVLGEAGHRHDIQSLAHDRRQAGRARHCDARGDLLKAAEGLFTVSGGAACREERKARVVASGFFSEAEGQNQVLSSKD